MADLHLDLPGELLFRHRAGEWDVIAQKYLSVWQKAGIALIGAAVYLEDDCLPESGLRNALLQIHALKQELQSLEGKVHLIRSQADLERAGARDSIGILLYLEGLGVSGLEQTESACLWLLQRFGKQSGERGSDRSGPLCHRKDGRAGDVSGHQPFER